MPCNRCTKRLNQVTNETNHGYCEDCLILVAREIIGNTENFDYSEQDRQWREMAKERLKNLYFELKDAGMENPLRGMTSKTVLLFLRLFTSKEQEKIYNE